MKLPVDVSALIQETADVEAARSVPLNVSVLLDDAAPDDLIAFVRSRFASASPQARVSVNYFRDGRAMYDPRSDMAVIAAGPTFQVGQIAEDLRFAGIPTMIVTTMPETVKGTAEENDTDMPQGDLIAPVINDGDILMLPETMTVSSKDGVDATVGDYDPMKEHSFEPYILDKTLEKELAYRMGEWVVAAFPQKKLAFAQAFDFVRKPLSREAINATALQNAGVGFVVFIPGADMPIMTANQAKMVIQIAAAYGQELTRERVKELVAVVAGGFACRAAARQICTAVPALGWAVKAAVGYGGTQAMGMAAIEYFEGGGSVSGLMNTLATAKDKAVATVESTRAGRGFKAAVADLGNKARKAAVDKAVDVVRQAPDKSVEAVRAVAMSVLDSIEYAANPEKRGN